LDVHSLQRDLSLLYYTCPDRRPEEAYSGQSTAFAEKENQHYGPMTAIALAGIFPGYLADKLSRKKTIILGLIPFSPSIPIFWR
jgi:hypothetical protein